MRVWVVTESHREGYYVNAHGNQDGAFTTAVVGVCATPQMAWAAVVARNPLAKAERWTPPQHMGEYWPTWGCVTGDFTQYEIAAIEVGAVMPEEIAV